MSALTFDVEQFKFVTSVACGREDREAERPIRETEDKEGGRREHDENGTGERRGRRGRGRGLDMAIEEEEKVVMVVVAEEEGGLTVPRGATCLMN